MRIGIICPRGVSTGGPEALHQLHFYLTELGYESVLIDLDNLEAEEVHDYFRYGPIWLRNGDEIANLSHLIVPEVTFKLPPVFRERFSGQLIVWWLSVDNSPHYKARWASFLNQNLPSRPWLTFTRGKLRNLLVLTHTFVMDLRARFVATVRGDYVVNLREALHISQSAYASEFIARKLGFKSLPCGDFLRKVPIPSGGKRTRFTVTFNGSKGGDLVEKVARLMPDLEFIALKNMPYQVLLTHLRQSHLYLDLGTFPGRDRIPREALRVGTPILIASRGAGGFDFDFPVPPGIQVDLKVSKPEDVASLIRLHLSRLDLAVSSQSKLSMDIEQDEIRFRGEVEKLTLVLRGDSET